MGERPRNTNNKSIPDAAANHLDAEEIGKFSNGELTATENWRVQKHLANCDRCRNDLVAIIRVAVAPVTEAERQLLQALPPFTGSEVLQRLLPPSPPPPAPDDWLPRWRAWLQNLVPQPIFAPALAAAMSVLLFLGTWGGYRLYVHQQIGGDLASGYAALRQHWHVSDEDYRPAGGFARSPFSRTHGPAASAAADPAVQAFQSVLRRDAENRKALLGMALFYSFSGNMARADSLLQLLLHSDSTEAQAWNQLGLVRARLEQPEAALTAFAAALRHQPDYHEAAFNRALVLTRLQRTEQARLAWRDYLQNDPNSSWSETAREHLRKLEQP